MAIFLLSYAVQDAKGKVARVQVPIPRGALTLAQVQQGSDLIGAALDNISDGLIVAADLRIGLTISGIVGAKVSPVLNCDVEEGVNFRYAAADTDYSHSIRVPAIAQALVSGEFIDDGNALVQAWNTAIVSGVDAGGTPVNPSDRYENDLTAFVDGKKTFRK